MIITKLVLISKYISSIIPKYKYVVFVTFILAISCKQKAIEENKGHKNFTQEQILLDSIITEILHENLLVDVNNSITGFDVIKLETTSGSLIGKIDKVLMSEGYVFIFDRYKANTVFMYNDNGKFIRKIGNKGKGAGEYLKIEDFDIDFDSKIVVLYDSRLKKVITLSFENKFISEFKIKFNANSLMYTKNGFVFNTNRKSNTKEYSFNIIKTDKFGKVTSLNLPYTEFDLYTDQYQAGGGIFRNPSIYEYGLFSITFNPEVMVVSKDSTAIFKNFNWGNRIIDKKEIDQSNDPIDNINKILKKTRTLQALTCYNSVYRTNKHLALTIQDGHRPTIFYNCKSNKIVCGYMRRSINKLMRKGCFVGQEIVGVSGETFISFVTPTQVEGLLIYSRNKNLKELEQIVKAQFGACKPEDNPYLVKYRIR